MTNGSTMEAPAAKSGVPWHLWVVGALAVLWNAFGCYDYVMSQIGGDEYLRAAGMTDAHIAYFHSMPAWMTGVWAIGVWGGLLGGVLLLLRMKLAVWVFVASFAAYLLSLAYTYFMSGGGQFVTMPMMIMQGVIALFCILFIWYASVMAKAGVLR